MAADLLVGHRRPLGFSKEKTKRFVLYSQYRESSDDNQMQREHWVRYAAELVLVCYLLCIKYSALSAPENILRWW